MLTTMLKVVLSLLGRKCVRLNRMCLCGKPAIITDGQEALDKLGHLDRHLWSLLHESPILIWLDSKHSWQVGHVFGVGEEYWKWWGRDGLLCYFVHTAVKIRRMNGQLYKFARKALRRRQLAGAFAECHAVLKNADIPPPLLAMYKSECTEAHQANQNNK